MKTVYRVCLAFTVLCLVWYGFVLKSAFADSGEVIPIKTVILESSGEPYAGQLGVAEVIRNRMKAWNKSPKEVCLAQNRKNKRFSFSCWNSSDYVKKRLSEPNGAKTWHNASKAWHTSERTNTVNGALYFESIDFIQDYKKWEKGKIILAVINKHIFFNYR